MHNQESVPENETHKVIWEFEIQTDHLIAAGRPDQVIVNSSQKDNLPNSGLFCPSGPQSNIKRRKERPF